MNIITELRASAGLSQQELAALADITRRYIISLEKGIPNSVPIRVLEVLSEGTGVTPRFHTQRIFKIQRDEN
ncbi:MAG: helix-turn-helix transcriptional regulator [Comamonadaceae bacterium]|nr:helix-turn-helix transcriptional regulator [Comamonadaceae bacterium]